MVALGLASPRKFRKPIPGTFHGLEGISPGPCPDVFERVPEHGGPPPNQWNGPGYGWVHLARHFFCDDA
jgi:hypothetical protein